MASFTIWLRRLAFFCLMITQSMLLSAYLGKYEGTSNWYFMAFSFGPAVFVWVLLLIFKALYLGCLFRIWGLYIMALVLNIAMVFEKVGDRIDKTEFLGPNVLKMVLCITPLLLLLLHRRSRWFRRRRKRDCFQVVFSHGRRSVRWNRDDRYRVRRKRARLWNTQSIQYSNDRVGLPQHVGISLANGRKQTH